MIECRNILDRDATGASPTEERLKDYGVGDTPRGVPPMMYRL
jgi:hypothetical protein